MRCAFAIVFARHGREVTQGGIQINWLLIPTLFGALICFVIGLKVSLWSRLTSQLIGWSALALGLALPALLFVIYYTHNLDRAAWFYNFRAAPYTELTASGIGFGAGLTAALVSQMSQLREARLLKPLVPVLVVFGTGLILLVPYVKPFVAPLRISLQDKWSDGVCLQSTPSTCGPCSAATLLKHFGINASEHELAQECYSYGGGTENWYIARALRRRGLNTEYVITPPQPEKLRFPSIAGVQGGGPGGGGHFIAILGQNGNRYVIGDPIGGKSIVTIAQLRARYYVTGFFLIAHPA